jgi:hypothetical protein
LPFLYEIFHLLIFEFHVTGHDRNRSILKLLAHIKRRVAVRIQKSYYEVYRQQNCKVTPTKERKLSFVTLQICRHICLLLERSMEHNVCSCWTYII